MGWFAHGRAALHHLLASKLRSLLAMLGIVVGSGAVVALLSCGHMATDEALSHFKSLGTDVIALVLVNKPGERSDQTVGLTASEVPQLYHASARIQSVAPVAQGYVSLYASGVTSDVGVIGVTQAFYRVAKVGIAVGRAVSLLDRGQLFCVVGSKLAQKIQHQGVDPLYSQVMVGSQMFTVVGIAKPWKPSVLFYADIDQGIIVPLTAAFSITGHDDIKEVLFKLSGDDHLKVVQQQLEALMLQLAPLKIVRFRDPQSIIDVVSKQRTTFTLLLASIGGIALLVGGIGVMNIMLVSVIERRKEIGIRMAVGAQRADILKMFLMESIVLTVLGGFVGIVMGVLISLILALFSGWAYHFYSLPPLLGFFVSVLVGIISGIYPAVNASRLDPVQTFSES